MTAHIQTTHFLHQLYYSCFQMEPHLQPNQQLLGCAHCRCYNETSEHINMHNVKTVAHTFHSSLIFSPPAGCCKWYEQDSGRKN